MEHSSLLPAYSQMSPLPVRHVAPPPSTTRFLDCSVPNTRVAVSESLRNARGQSHADLHTLRLSPEAVTRVRRDWSRPRCHAVPHVITRDMVCLTQARGSGEASRCGLMPASSLLVLYGRDVRGRASGPLRKYSQSSGAYGNGYCHPFP